MPAKKDSYPARLTIDYPKKLDRLSSFFRGIWAIPIVIVYSALVDGGGSTYMSKSGEAVSQQGGGIVGGLFAATLLMILFRQRYPRWWFNFNLELNRFATRIGAYLFLLTDKYPSTEDEQTVHLELDYPDAKKDLNRWLPLVKWFLAIPHYFVLFFLALGVFAATIIAWFSILFTGTYPRGLFDFVVGVNRYGLRVAAYAFLLNTDEYPPFSLD